jgi:glycosyltransferase involved in cell wall biosynthesis
MAHLRRWDLKAAKRVDHFMTNSRHVAERIRRHYGREARVIYPPVNVQRFSLSKDEDNYYLVVSALVPYKRIDLAVRAFNQLSKPLKIVGQGPEFKRLNKLAGPTVEFLGNVSNQRLAQLYARCRALIFPGEEDFGIVPLEAQASGRPVIAYGKGGVEETVIPLNPREPRPSHEDSVPTGLFFYEQNVEAAIEAVRSFEANCRHFDRQRLRQHASRFDRALFKEKIRSFIEEKFQYIESEPPLPARTLGSGV